MAAKILALAPGQHAFAAALTPAWHRLGVTMDRAMTAQEALEAAHLANWNVRKVPLMAHADLTVDGVSLAQEMEVPDRFATIYTNPVTQANTYLGVVGTHYAPIQNETHADLLDAIVGESGAHFDTAGALNGGRQTFMAMRMPEDMMVGGVDAVGQYLIAMNSHDGNGSFRFLVSPIRVVCSNTLAAAIKSAKASFSIRHTASASGRIQEAREALGMTWKYLESFQMEAELMMDTQVADDEFAALVAQFYKPTTASTRATSTAARHIAGVTKVWASDSPTMADVKGTRWGVYQAITEYLDHHQDVRGGEDITRARRAISQEGTEAKVAAFNLLKVGA